MGLKQIAGGSRLNVDVWAWLIAVSSKMVASWYVEFLP